MSGLIDDIIFQTLQNLQSSQKHARESARSYEIFHKLKVNQKYHLLKNNQQVYETKSIFDTPNKSFLVHLHVKKQNFSTKFIIVEVNQLFNSKSLSKHQDLLSIKQFFKPNREFPVQANIYINNGRAYLAMNNFLPPNKLLKSSKIIDVYNSLMHKNLQNFENFTSKYIQDKNKSKSDQQIKSFHFNKQLQLARILNTTENTKSVDFESAQFVFVNETLKKRKEQLNLIKQNISQQLSVQISTEQLYQFIHEEVTTNWLKDNCIPFYEENQSKFTSILNLSLHNTQKRLEDFVFNMANIEIKQMINKNKPYCEGGFSYIFGARAYLHYISSADMTQLPQNPQTAERFIAIKKLKQTEQKKTRNKLQHEKEIAMKMRGSTCPFLPKYYGTDSSSQLQNCLIMELFQGEELDYYVASRTNTITLWSKIYLLLNVIHSIRHLISYKITHLDLKPNNVLVVKNMITKLIDFGEAYHPQICPKNYIPGVSFPYCPPEVFVRNAKLVHNKPDNETWQYSEKQDAYSFGIMMYQIIFGGTIFPLSFNKLREVYFKRQNAQRFFSAPQRVQDYGENTIMSNILYLIVRCLDPDPARRPCFQWIGISLKLILNSYFNIP